MLHRTVNQVAMAVRRMAQTSSKYTTTLVALLVVGSALQASLSLLHHAHIEDAAAAIRKEEASISPCSLGELSNDEARHWN
jgi:hypothetical protein